MIPLLASTLLASAALGEPKSMDFSSRIDAFGASMASHLGLARSSGAESFSPLSVHMAFSMLWNGCDEPQASGLAKALGISGTSVNDSYRPLIGGLPDGLHVANGIWRVGPGKLQSKYVRLVESDYRARVSAGMSPAQAQADADEFVKTNTKGRISKLPLKIRPNTMLVLVNALSFDGDWRYKFAARSTRKEPFKGPKGEAIVDMMHLAATSLDYVKIGSTQYLNLPYRDGRFSMWIALPDAGTPMTFSFASAAATAKAQRVTVALPKFHLRSEFDLIPSMTAMGASAIFQVPSPYSKIFVGGDRSIVSQAVHVADVAVDEDGTKAAAVTAIGMMRAGIMRDPHPPIPFVVDRPFTFAIWDEQLKVPVFIGAVHVPKV